MRRLLINAVIVFVTGLLALQCQARDYKVKMLNNGEDGFMSFSPGFLKLNKGDTVTFLPRNLGHNAVLSFAPKGVKPWEANHLNERMTVTLNEEGVYIYICEPHLKMAMVGVIQVGDAHNKVEASIVADELQQKFMFNKDRLDKYISLIN